MAFCDGAISDCKVVNNPRGMPSWEGGGLFLCNAEITGCVISGNAAYGGGGLCACLGKMSDCVITNNSSDYGAGVAAGGQGLFNCLIIDNHGEGVRGYPDPIANCTIAGNSAWGLDSCVGIISNCVLWGNNSSGDDQLLECSIPRYSCIENWPSGGEGNISQNPLFVNGPLGDYYLSCKAAGQAADSPCIDAGNGTAESLGLDRFTTRTDGAPDAGVVDMGYHYPLTLPQNPQIECSLNSGEFGAGDTLVGFVEAHNPGPDVTVDAYIAFVLPDGAVVSLTGAGLASGIYPWASNVTLPSGFDLWSTGVFQMTVPDCPGSYLFAAALAEPGQFELIGEPSLFAFRITD